MHGEYEVCRDVRGEYKLTVNLGVEIPEDAKSAISQGFVLGWGLGYEGHQKIEAYMSMNSKRSYNWTSLSASLPVSVDYLSKSPR